MSFPTPEEFIKKNAFDYIVVGGGTAGLVVAARLSEDVNVTVGVLEAGGYHPEEPLINVPGYFGRALGNPAFDWAFLTVPQKHLNDRPIFHPRGKLFAAFFTYACDLTGKVSGERWKLVLPIAQLEILNAFAIRLGCPEHPKKTFETLGNEGWNWLSFLKYIKKSQTLIPSDNEFNEKINSKLADDMHGTYGPVSVNLIRTLLFQRIGIRARNWVLFNSFLGRPGHRPPQLLCSCILRPNASRPNLVVLTGAQVTKIALEGDAEPYTATAIEFVSGGKVYSVPVKREVILSAGAFQTPQLLELSGIGDKSVLDQFSIPTKVELPGVGSNLQDHNYVPTVYEVKPELATLDPIRSILDLSLTTMYPAVINPLSKEYYTSTHSAFAFLPINKFTPPAEVARLKAELRDSTGFDSTPGLKKQRQLLEEWFDNERHAQLEIITYPGFFPSPGKTPKPNTHYHTVLVANTHPISRGTVHIQSADALVKPAVDPAYLSSTIDLDVLVHAVRFTRTLHRHSPLREMTIGSVEPVWIGGDDGVEKGIRWEDDEAVREYVRNGLEPVYHPVGTAAMLPREDHGVVDSKLKVYGTANLRVADASVFPFNIAAHIQETIYGIAEKVSDIIKADAKQQEDTINEEKEH
ncbi:GMC oxidoreductase [Hydnum rufescens UP504]|uniref:GMC oxidoreductase n=1 Tax=Hydnum rufescens UP504 TaxID=1448309 RepID=A0A9P6E0T4_9AGAM|nr:GMC oxidoreductase [Hydnum rufescens UP504]